MKLFYLTGFFLAIAIFQTKAQEIGKEFKIGTPLYDFKGKSINPFENQTPYSQLKSLEEKNGRVIPLNRELNLIQGLPLPERRMPMAEMESNDPMPMKYVESDINYTLLIKPLK